MELVQHDQELPIPDIINPLTISVLLYLHKITEWLILLLCLSVCLCVCVHVSELNSSRTDAPIWTWFSLNGCIPH